MANSTIVFGTNVLATFPNARSVQSAGKSVTDSSPMTTMASPRNSASVPIVTASEGRPRRVTSTPLKAPHSAPTTMQIGMIVSIGWLWFQRYAITALDSARTDATERSISAAMITIVSGSAISATSDRSSEPVVNESAVRNSGEMIWPAIARTISSPTSSVSQRPSSERQAGGDDASAGGAVCGAAVSVCTACAPPPQGGLDAQREQSIERDREQEQRADRRLLPERGDTQHDQRGRDRPQQQRAERGAVDGAGPTEDGDAADDGGRDHGQLVADAGGRVDGAETGGEQHAAEAGQRTRQHERDQHAP